MIDYSNNAENLKYELKSLKAKYLEIDENKKCEECYDSIFDQEFYVFPCLHCFHRVPPLPPQITYHSPRHA